MDPTLRNRLIANLNENIELFSPQLQKFARYILEHEVDFAMDTARDTAAKCQVSTFTLTRLARLLGFSTFVELREPFRQSLVQSSPNDEAAEWSPRVDEEGIFADLSLEVSRNAFGVLKSTFDRVSTEQIVRVVSTLLDAERVFVLGTRSSYGIAQYFSYVAKMTAPNFRLAPSHMNDVLEDLNDLREDDILLVICFPPYAKDSIRAAKLAQEKGVGLIIICDSESPFLDFSPIETLTASTVSAHHFASMVGVIGLLEKTLAVLSLMGGKEASTRLKDRESFRVKHSVYWKYKSNKVI